VRRALAAAALAALLPCAAGAGVRPAYGGTVRVGLAGPPGGTGPGALLAARATAAPLLEVDARGRLAPGALAEVPAAEAGARAFRLRLRPGLVDAAGRPIGAEQLAAHLAALLRDRGGAAWVALPVLGADAVLDGRAPLLGGVQVLSPVEVLVTLAFPLPELPWLLAALPAALPGAGPFTAEPSRSPDAVVLRANPRHHLGRPFADAVELRAVDARGAARQLEQGSLHLVVRPEAAGGIAAPPLPALAATVAIVNPARLGPAAEGVRRALEALDRGDLARRLVRGRGEPLRTLVPPAILPGAPPPPAAAAPAAAAARRIALLADASAPDQRALAERIQVKLFDGGLRAAVEPADRARHAERLAAGDYDVALVTVQVAALRPALAAGQVAFAARGPAAGRRAMAALSGLSGEEALAAADRLGRELDLVPLVASAPRASLARTLQGFAAGADGGVDPGGLWILGGAR
jgi:peptide/nickel transport system substrate-binding protein